jgi:hypothetical protein
MTRRQRAARRRTRALVTIDGKELEVGGLRGPMDRAYPAS